MSDTSNTNFDDLSREQLVQELKKLANGGLAGARLRNELQELNERDPDEIKDGYQLRFIGKDYARLQASLATETVVVPNTTHNTKQENKASQNIFITGDNLDALKHLENSYSGQIDIIYIDPPYNTGTDGFVYNDTFNFTDDDLKLKLGLSDQEVERIRNLDGKSSHSAWLTFMYPRLLIAKRLLKDTGVIFISIDDNEQADLRVLCDEIFVETNSMANLVWEGTGKNDSHYFSIAHDYIFVYARNITALKDYKSEWRQTKKGLDKIYAQVDLLKKEYGDDYASISKQLKKWFTGLQKTEDAWRHRHYSDVDKNGIFFAGDISWPGGGGPKYEVLHPTTHKPVTIPSRGWVYGDPEVMKQKIAEGLVVFGPDETKVPTLKRYLHKTEGSVPPGVIYKDRRGAKQSLVRLMGGDYFDTPKDTNVLKDLINLAADENALILDFFSGSGTTAESVMQLNAADGGNRKHIQVQLHEPVKQGSEAERKGYKAIDEIARKRIELACKKIQDESGKDLASNFDGGFRHYILASPDVQTLDKLDEFDPSQTTLLPEDMVEPFSADQLGVEGGADGTSTLLTTWLLDDGYHFENNHERLAFAGGMAYRADRRLYIIDNGWTTDSTKQLLNSIGTNKLQISTIIIYPYAIAFETLRELKTNLRTNLDGDHKVEIIERY